VAVLDRESKRGNFKKSKKRGHCFPSNVWQELTAGDQGHEAVSLCRGGKKKKAAGFYKVVLRNHVPYEGSAIDDTWCDADD
jgi:hypothetical protein